jgi:putative ABC transport system substrate-binding protein
MRRREFITLIGGAAAATWPFATAAQQPAVPVIGFLHSASAEPTANLVRAFRKGLFDLGFIETQNVRIDFRWADGQNDRLPELAADLVRRNVNLIATPGSTPAALAAKAATATIPIVFATGSDPVAIGLVNSINHPGGNATGIDFETVEMQGKAIELLHQLLPNAVHFTALVNPTYVFRQALVKNMQAGAASLGLQLEVLDASTDGEIENAFKVAAQRPGTPLIVGPDPFFTSRRSKLAALQAGYAVPTMYDLREFAEGGGLISYGPELRNVYREAGTYSGRILKGEKPAEIPVVLSTKFEMVINVKTAKSLGIAVPDRLLALADEVIE